MNLFYIKNRITLSIGFYITILMLYFLIKDILIPRLNPVIAVDSRFVLSLLSDAKIEEIAPQKEPAKKEEPIVKQDSEKPQPIEKILEKVIEETSVEEAVKVPIVKQPEAKKPETKKPETKQMANQKKLAQDELEQSKMKKLAEEKRKQDLIDTQTIVIEAQYNDTSLNNPSPKYPIISRKEGEEGEVVLLVKIDINGKPVDIVLLQSSGFERLDNASMYAVKNWQFKPAKNKFGGNVESAIKIPFVFKIRG